MIYPQKIDLHMHTEFSDGTDGARELLQHVKDAGLQLFSVTDHDSIDGIMAVRRILKGDDPRLVNGIEFSTKDCEGKYHILGYNYSLDAPLLLSVVQKAHEARLEKTERRLDFLSSEYQMTFPEEEISWLFGNLNPGKPHIAQMMVRCGYVSSVSDAMKNYLDKKRVPNKYIDPQEAIEAILSGGGIPVLAHPCFGDGGQQIHGIELERRVRRLVDMGLQGVEAYYSGFSLDEISEVNVLAERYDLYVTAGSDYHGRNKTVRLGNTGLNNPENISDVPDGLKRFIMRVMD